MAGDRPARPAVRADPRARRRPRGRRVRRAPSTPTSSTAPARRSSRSSRRSAPTALAAGDHFGKPGANDRIWNAAQKLALHDPAVFADYYANDALAVVCQAWLGPRYQVTSQVNVVNPGGNAAGSAPRLSPRLRPRRAPRAVSGAPAPHVAGADAAGRGRALRHAGGERARRCCCRTRSASPAATSRSTGPSSSTTSPSHHVQLPLQQGRRGVLQPGAVSRCGIEHLDRHPRGSRTCCRSRRRSAGRWRRWTAPRWCAPSTRRCAR